MVKTLSVDFVPFDLFVSLTWPLGTMLRCRVFFVAL